LGVDDGMSRRTFTRAFRAETGLSFGEWQFNACLALALDWLAAGMTMHDVAHRLGYSSLGNLNRAFGAALSGPAEDPISASLPSRPIDRR